MILVILMCVQVSTRICHFFERLVRSIFIQSNLNVRPPPIQNTKNFPVKDLQLESLVNDHLL